MALFEKKLIILIIYMNYIIYAYKLTHFFCITSLVIQFYDFCRNYLITYDNFQQYIVYIHIELSIHSLTMSL